MEQKKETDNILNSLAGLQKASPGHFFFTRVQARLQKEEISFWGRIAAFLAKPTVALSTLCLICLLNAAALVYQRTSSSAPLTDQFEQTNIEDYNTTVAANSYYDENTEAR